MFNNRLAYSKFLINISQDCWVFFFFWKETQPYKTDKIDTTAQAIITEESCFQNLLLKCLGARVQGTSLLKKLFPGI